MGSLGTGVSALQAFTQGMDVIGNNIANVNTTGFKSSTVDYENDFGQVLYESSGATGSSPITSQIGSGVSVADIAGNYSQGNITSTGVSTDLAVSGNGYFVVEDGSGDPFVTRAGNFSTSTSGYLQTSSGAYLVGLTGGSVSYTVSQDAGGNLVFTKDVTTAPSTVGKMTTSYTTPTVENDLLTVDKSVTKYDTAQIDTQAETTLGLTSYAFDSSGNLTFTLQNGDSYAAGQVLLTSFSNQNALVSAGNNLYTNLDAAGPLGGSLTISSLTAATNAPGTNGLGTFKTDSLESSNVDLTSELTNMISVERSFQAASRIITVSNDMLQDVVDLGR